MSDTPRSDRLKEQPKMVCTFQTIQNCFDMSDTSRSMRPSDFDEDFLNGLIYADARHTTRELASEMGCDHAKTVRHLQSMGRIQKPGVWVPHILTRDNKDHRVAI
jgi:hypothetical protein